MKCTSISSSVKRKRTTAYHRENGLDINQGSWTLQGTCIFVESVESFLFLTSIILTVLRNYVVSSSSAFSNNSCASHKTMEQVMGKQEYYQEAKSVPYKID